MFHRCAIYRRRPILLAAIVLLTLAAAVKLHSYFVSTSSTSSIALTGRAVDPPEVVQSGEEFIVDIKRRRYISAMCFDSRRLGNLMFNYASLLGIARSNGMVAVMPRHGNWSLPTIFNLQVLRTTVNRHDLPADRKISLNSFSPFLENRSCAYDPETETLAHRRVMLHGFYQSWRYFSSVPRRELIDHFRFNRHVTVAAARLWRELVRQRNATSSSRSKPRRPEVVGVHVRRGDYVRSSSNVAYGYTIADENYFRRAMRFFIDRYPRVDFIICSDEIAWARRHVTLPEVPREVGRRVRVAYCSGGSPGGGDVNNIENAAIDMAVLSRCDHVIMSTGTFGWWAAWLAGGTTIYYEGWPRLNSTLSAQVDKTDFFPPHWIPM